MKLTDDSCRRYHTNILTMVNMLKMTELAINKMNEKDAEFQQEQSVGIL